MSSRAGQLLSGAEVTVGGTALPVAVTSQLVEIRVDQDRRLPDRCTLRIADPHLDLIDSDSFPLGAELDVSFSAPTATAETSLFAGPIASLEPEFEAREAILTVRAYDASHRLNHTRRTVAFQDTSYGGIARRIASQNGLGGGTIEDAGGTVPFVQQSNETDWEFLWRLADEIGFEAHVAAGRLDFRRASRSAGGTVALEWGKGLLSFRPRATAVQQVRDVTVRAWDPSSRQPIEATASASSTASIGIPRTQAMNGLGAGTVTVADRPVSTAAQASALAQGIAEQLGDTFVEAEGAAIGNPALRAGTAIQVDGVGSRFGGRYLLSSATHAIRGGRGYETRFTVSPRAARSMLELTSVPSERPWRHGVVVGIVTNNDDPAALGRVRVRYPVLGTGHEGWWARVTAPSAGTNRGLLMVPQVGDEVVLAFEHGDEERPYVVGSVWNGAAKPETLVHPDGSLAVRSDKQVLVDAAEPMALTTKKAMTLSAAGDVKVTTTEQSGEGAPGKVEIAAKGDATTTAGTAVKLEAGTEMSLQGAEVKVTAGGEMTIQATGAVTIKGGVVQVQADELLRLSGPEVMLG